MSTRNAFVQRQHDEAKETLEKLRGHVTAIEEKLRKGERPRSGCPCSTRPGRASPSSSRSSPTSTTPASTRKSSSSTPRSSRIGR
jgi:hypothetical protein